MRGKRSAWTVFAVLGFGGCRIVLGIEDSSVVDQGADASVEANLPDVDAETGNELPDHQEAEAAVPIDAGCDAALDTSENCGSCGHDCLGGQCANGKCTPVKLKGTTATYMLPVGAPGFVFVSNHSGPDVFRVDRKTGLVESTSFAGSGTVGVRVEDGFVYFADDFGKRVLRASSSGSFDLTSLVEMSAYSSFGVSDVFVDTDRLYVLDSCFAAAGERVWGADLDGGNVVPIAVELPCIIELEADATDLWAVSGEDSTVYRLPRSGLPIDAGFVHTEQLSTDATLHGTSLEMDSEVVYVALSSQSTTPPGAGIYRFRKDGVGAPEQIATAEFVTHMTLYEGALYWTDQGSLDGATGTIKRFDTVTPNAQPETLFTALPQPLGLVVDADVIYFTAYGGGELGPGIYRVAR